MGNLNRAFVSSLTLALKREIIGDRFVIKNTCKHIENSLELLDQEGLKDLNNLLTDFLSNQEEISIGIQLEELFTDSFSHRDYRNYYTNINKLKHLKQIIEDAIE